MKVTSSDHMDLSHRSPLLPWEFTHFGFIWHFSTLKKNKCMASSPSCVSLEGPFLSMLYNVQRLRTYPALLSSMLSVKNVWPVFGQGTSFQAGLGAAGLGSEVSTFAWKGREKRFLGLCVRIWGGFPKLSSDSMEKACRDSSFSALRRRKGGEASSRERRSRGSWGHATGQRNYDSAMPGLLGQRNSPCWI